VKAYFKRFNEALTVAEATKTPTKSPAKQPRDETKFCEYHNRRGHSTSEWEILKREIGERLQQGKLTEIAKIIKKETDKSQTPRQQWYVPHNKGKAAEILTISTYNVEGGTEPPPEPDH